MTEITLEQAQTDLEQLIAGLRPGEEILILQNDQPIARLVTEPKPSGEPRTPGSAVGKLWIVAEDDEHLDDFRQYTR